MLGFSGKFLKFEESFLTLSLRNHNTVDNIINVMLIIIIIIIIIILIK